MMRAPLAVERLRATGVEVGIDEFWPDLMLGSEVTIALHTKKEHAASLRIRDRGGRLQCTEWLLVDELELARWLYWYCFDEWLDAPFSRDPVFHMNRCLESFDRRLAAM